MKQKYLPYNILNIFYLILFFHLVFWLLAPRIPFPEIIPDVVNMAGLLDLQNFKLVFLALLNSLIVAALVIAINLIFALPIALLLTKYQNRTTNLISSILYIPILAPVLLPAFGLYEFFIRTNFIGTYVAVALAQSTIIFPYMLKPIENYLRNRGYYLEQIAYDLGESNGRAFFKVTLPALYSPIIFGSFLCFIGSFNDYLIAFLIGDLNVSTLSVVLYPLIQSDNRITSIITIIIYIAPLVLLVIYSARLKIVKKAGNLYARN
ncbi:MAG: ABC transporter permease subunit [Kordiimonadaceae bacterium]|jgi:putative spermidine/putrescine transport system permease protein|nr:ABC transporter permease subunit [Kordiimonadaceae bacterium]MBT6032551.1 ABC transporter permease subunit [Kordiimonadaceae bacterium]